MRKVRSRKNRTKRKSVESSTSSIKSNLSAPELDLEITVKRCVNLLVHVTKCRNDSCRHNVCAGMKIIVLHSQVCVSDKDNCPVCARLYLLSFCHAKTCTDAICKVPFCDLIRERMAELQRLSDSLENCRRCLLPNKNHTGNNFALQTSASTANDNSFFEEGQSEGPPSLASVFEELEDIYYNQIPGNGNITVSPDNDMPDMYVFYSHLGKKD